MFIMALPWGEFGIMEQQFNWVPILVYELALRPAKSSNSQGLTLQAAGGRKPGPRAISRDSRFLEGWGPGCDTKIGQKNKLSS